MEKKELKVAIEALEKNSMSLCSLYIELVSRLIDIYILEDNKSASKFWKDRMLHY